MCENRIIKYVTKENVLKYLDFAISSNTVDLESYAKRLITLYLDAIINITEFKKKLKIILKYYSILKEKLLEKKMLFLIK